MRRAFRSCRLLVLFALGGLTAAGCGGGGARPKGQLLTDGQPYKLVDGESVAVTFNSTEPGKGSAAATVAQDGSFTIQGDGLQSGSYMISVLSTNTNSEEKYRDKFNNAFNGASSPLKVDIGPESSPTIDIDLGKKTATKK